ncbi:MAG: hypothetical protein Q4E89_02830 [Eubacteriales bacterium]|nr:hypothetical protein [Eubacteriales bacterium]
MIVFPAWLLKYILAIGGFGVFFTEGEFWGLIIGIIGIIWIVLSFMNKKDE